MHWFGMVVVSLAVLAACATSSSSPIISATECGGELRVADMPNANIERGSDSLAIWGMTEVPAASRLQAAYAMVDAIARAELVKLVQVTIASEERDVDDGQRQTIELRTRETVAARVPTLGVLQHGWQRVSQDGQPALRIVGRLTVTRTAMRELLAGVFGDAHGAWVDEIVAALLTPMQER
jgi:hypothetical protein